MAALSLMDRRVACSPSDGAHAPSSRRRNLLPPGCSSGLRAHSGTAPDPQEPEAHTVRPRGRRRACGIPDEHAACRRSSAFYSSRWSHWGRCSSPLPFSASFLPIVVSMRLCPPPTVVLGLLAGLAVFLGHFHHTRGPLKPTRNESKNPRLFERRRPLDGPSSDSVGVAVPGGTWSVSHAGTRQEGPCSDPRRQEQQRCCGSGGRGSPAPADRINGERRCSFAASESRRFSVPLVMR